MALLKNSCQFMLALLLALIVTVPAQAAESTLNQANTAWILTASALVLMMTLPGLAMFYGGLVRSKNVLSVLMHCVAIACLSSVPGDCLFFLLRRRLTLVGRF